MSDILLANGELCDKLKAHKEGLQHYAFSVFLFNNKNELLLQKRAKQKYHSGGLWSNTCCSHFRNIHEFQNKEQTAKNRLKEELGIIFNDKLSQIDIFNYQTNVGNSLIENEIDYIFSGRIDDSIKFNLNYNEVEDIKFIKIEEIKNDIQKNEQNYTNWLVLMSKKNIF